MLSMILLQNQPFWTFVLKCFLKVFYFCTWYDDLLFIPLQEGSLEIQRMDTLFMELMHQTIYLQLFYVNILFNTTGSSTCSDFSTIVSYSICVSRTK